MTSLRARPRRISAGLLRFLIAAIAFLYLQAAVVLGALVIVRTRGATDPGAAAMLFAVGSTVVVLVEVTVASASSSVRFDEPESRVHLRRAVVVLAALAVVGLAAQIVAIPLGMPVEFGVPAVGIALLLAPALVALGRVARRREVRRAGTDPAGRALRAWRTGVRWSLIGFGIGLVAATLLTVALSVFVRPGHASRIPNLVIDGLAIACFSGAVAGLVSQVRITRIVREIVGTEYGRVRRIARVVLRGKPDLLSDEESAAASAYARVIGLFLRAQLLSFAFLYAGILLNFAGQLLRGTGGALPAVLLPAFVLFIGALAVVYARRIRRARRYAEAHGVLAA